MNNKIRYCHICKCPAAGGHWILHKDIPADKRKHDFYVYNFPKLADKDWLYDQYVNKKASLPILCKLVGDIDLKAMQFMLNYYGIQLRSIKQALNLDETKQRYVTCCMKKYGTSNALSKGTTAYIKRNNTVLNKYGVENVFQIVDEFVPKNKSYATFSKISRLNMRIKNVLDEKKVPYKAEFGIKFVDADKRQRWKLYDFLLLGTNILIEVNGDYWHANPAKYAADTVFQFPKMRLTAQEIWNIDAHKRDIAIQNGYDVIYLWEHTLKEMTNDDLATFIEDCKNRAYQHNTEKI